MASPRLQLEDIVCAFDGVAAVNGVSLTVDSGEILCLLGPSGCGKTTSLRAAAGVERPQSGQVVVDGKTVTSSDIFVAPEHRRVGLMFQDYALFPHLSVLDNVMFGLKGQRKSKARARAMDMLALVHMEDFADAYPHTLSGGEQQRIALARAIAPEPAVMLMDEPFSGLDRHLRDKVRDQTLDVLKETGTATLMVTHDPEEALRMGDRIAVMRDGKVVQIGDPVSLYDAPADPGVARFFGDVNIIHGKVVEPGKALTPFGPVRAAAQDPVGHFIEVLVRPYQLHLTDAGTNTAAARVQRARLVGADALIEVILEDSGEKLDITSTNHQLPEIGDQVLVAADLAAPLVFPCQTQPHLL